MRHRSRTDRFVEWPTAIALACCYGVVIGALLFGATLWITVPLLALCIAFQSSLQHEIIHGHPFRAQWLNESLVWPSLNLLIPFARFRDTHLDHHRNENLTDPYDDPESNFLSPRGWAALCGLRRPILRANNTLLGRLILGPLVGQVYFMLGDWRLIQAGHSRVLRQWLGHLAVMVPLVWLITLSPVPLWAYALSAYLGISILKLRTFAEHQAHERVGGRSVIIEDRGLLALLFLNNNYHAVHHMHPKLPWYDLPATYRARKGRFLRRNFGYAFPSYGTLFRHYLIKAKDPVVHPHWHSRAE